MHITLAGNSPSAMTAGIMLLTRARQLGFPLTVAVVGDPDDLAKVSGPAVLYAPVLASCGVGREDGSGATVVMPGHAAEPLMISLDPHGVGDWFYVDRRSEGHHPASQAFVRLSRDPRPPARQLARDLRRLFEAVGVAPEPAVLDVLFGAPVPPLLRLAVALRAGRAITGSRGTSLTRFLAGSVADARDPLPSDVSPQDIVAGIQRGDFRWILDRLSTVVRDRVEDWVSDALAIYQEDGPRDAALLAGLVELASHLAQLPVHSILPPLGAAEDSVAVNLGAALKAEGQGDANLQLSQVYRFLGGRFVDADPHATPVDPTPRPSSTDTVALWRWFCGAVRIGRKSADALWDSIFDPAQ